MKYELYVSSSQFTSPNLEVRNSLGDSVEILWTRSYFKGLSNLVKEIELQYQGANISRKSRLFLAIRNQLSVFYRNPKLGFIELLLGHKGNIEISSLNELPLEIHPRNSTEISWISRNAIVGGVFSNTFGADIEWDRLRFSKNYAFFVWSLVHTYENEPRRDINDYSLKRIQVSLSPGTLNDVSSRQSTLRYQIIDNCIIHNGIFTRKESEVYLIDDSNGIENINWPTNKVSKRKDSLQVLSYLEQEQIRFPKVIILGFSSSWYHFLVEVVPRFIQLPKSDYSDHFVIVRGFIPQSIREAINFLGFENIYSMSDGQEVHAESVVTVSDFRYPQPLEIEQRKEDLILVRNFFTLSKEHRKSSRLIYLKRNQKLFRPLYGQKKIEAFLIDMGFEIISPETLDFRQQLILFAEAKIVVSESGAALTNMLFMSPDSLVVEINPGRDPLKLWSRFAKTIGIQLVLFEGRPFRIFNAFTGIGMFRINLSRFKHLIELVIQD